MAEYTIVKVEHDALGTVPVRMTKLEAFIRNMVDRANGGDRQSADTLAAYIAGKPGRAADPKQEDKTAEEALDRAGIAMLNSLSQAKEEDVPVPQR